MRPYRCPPLGQDQLRSPPSGDSPAPVFAYVESGTLPSQKTRGPGWCLLLTALVRVARETQAQILARLIAWDRRQTLCRQFPARTAQCRTR